MPAASYLQTSFLGGKWSPYAQGRADKETYRTALNECFNWYPVPVGAAVRRQGTLFGATTRNGVRGVVRTFDFSQNQPFSLEFTPGHLRMWSGLSLLLTGQHAVASISSATPAVVNTPVAHGYSTGDQVEFQATFLTPGLSPSGLKPLFNRQFSITVIDANDFSLQDPVTGANIDGSTINASGWLISVAKVVDYAVPYQATDLDNIRVVQSEDTALILCPGYKPKQIVNVNSLSGLGTNQISVPVDVVFNDGPYLDPPTDGSTLTPSGVSGTVTLAASSIASINAGQGFLSTDVGRLVRMFAQPPQWASGTTYTTGQTVTYNNAYYASIVTGNVNHEPDTDPGTHWNVATTAAAWTWAIIQTVTDTLHVTATIQAADPLGILAGGPLKNSNALTVWQLGTYSNSTVWPTGGTFHEGRFWLFSGIKNRADASMSNNNGTPVQQALNFAPTSLDGTVADNNGIAAVFEGTSTNSIFWMVSTETGIVIGTQAGEWVVAASATDDPITPTSIQARRKTRYGCANVEPVVAPLATLFVQRYQRHLYEYISDVYSRKWTGTNVAEMAQDIILPGIAEIALVQEPVPILWARTTDGRLVGMSYKRESPFGTQPASFFGWHHHALGSGRQIVSMRSGPAALGNTDNVTMVTLDPSTGIYFVEFMGPYFDESMSILQADFVDAAVTPAAAEVSGNNVIFYGLNYIAGKTITAWVGGVDGGDYTVAADGTLTMPFNVAQGLLTSSYLASLTGGNFALNIQVTPPGQGFFSPFGALSNYVFSDSPILHYADGLVDFDRNRAYFEAAAVSGDPQTDGHSLWVFNATTQALVAGPLDPGEFAVSGVIGARCIGLDGNLYYGTNDATHLVGRYNTTTHTNDINYNDTHGLDAVGNITTLTLGASTYVAYASLTGGTGSRINVVNMTDIGGPAWTGQTFTVSENPGTSTSTNAFMCRGPVGSCFAVGLNGYPANTANTVMGLYRIAVDSPTSAGMSRIGSVTPATLNAVSGASWTSFSVSNPLYDETDGNILLFMAGSDSTIRLVKLNSATAAVMFVSAAMTFGTTPDPSRYRVRGGRLTIISGGSSPWKVYEINTLTGAINSTNTQTLISPQILMGDDKTGLLVMELNNITNTQWTTFGPATGGGTIIPAVVYNAPTLLGFTYTSNLQLLPPVSPQEAGTQEGPAMGKEQRTAIVAVKLASTQGLSMGTDFTATMRPLDFRSAQGGPTELTLLQLFTDVHKEEIEDDYSFASKPGFQVIRPYPANILAVSGFIHTQDRH